MMFHEVFVVFSVPNFTFEIACYVGPYTLIIVSVELFDTRAEPVPVCIYPLAKPVPVCIFRDPNTKGKLSAKYQ